MDSRDNDDDEDERREQRAQWRAARTAIAIVIGGISPLDGEDMERTLSAVALTAFALIRDASGDESARVLAEAMLRSLDEKKRGSILA